MGLTRFVPWSAHGVIRHDTGHRVRKSQAHRRPQKPSEQAALAIIGSGPPGSLRRRFACARRFRGATGDRGSDMAIVELDLQVGAASDLSRATIGLTVGASHQRITPSKYALITQRHQQLICCVKALSAGFDASGKGAQHSALEPGQPFAPQANLLNDGVAAQAAGCSFEPHPVGLGGAGKAVAERRVGC